jgi:hypothetical protein
MDWIWLPMGSLLSSKIKTAIRDGLVKTKNDEKRKTALNGMDWKNALNGGPGGGPLLTIIKLSEVQGMNADGNQNQYGREKRQDH